MAKDTRSLLGLLRQVVIAHGRADRVFGIQFIRDGQLWSEGAGLLQVIGGRIDHHSVRVCNVEWPRVIKVGQTSMKMVGNVGFDLGWLNLIRMLVANLICFWKKWLFGDSWSLFRCPAFFKGQLGLVRAGWR